MSGRPGAAGDKWLRGIADQLAIQRVLCLYSRGIDRCDMAVLEAVFWPDATARFGAEELNALVWARATLAALQGMERTQHALSNMLITIDGDVAEGETYCTAYHEVRRPAGPMEMVVGGRYLDRLEKRQGEWRIIRRLYVMDWNRNVPSTATWDEGLYATLVNRGGRKPNDPLYAGARRD